MTNNFDSEIECGKGKYATVYKSEWHSREVAVKVYESENKDYAENEFEAFTALSSYPNIIPLIGICFDKKYVFVMNYVPRTLKQVIHTGIQSWPQTLKILKQLAYGIRAIIDAHYVVGDIKPDNILVDMNYDVYVCDFGSARRGGRELPTKNLHYSAKEVGLSGNGDPQKTDIFSYGVILLEMIMKYHDFDQLETNVAMAKQVDAYLLASHGKKNKKAANSSGKGDPHVTIKARAETRTRDHVVHRALLDSGCTEVNAKKISKIGIDCTAEHINSRPMIDAVISDLEGLR